MIILQWIGNNVGESGRGLYETLFRNLTEGTGKNEKISFGISGLSLEILTHYLPKGKKFSFHVAATYICIESYRKVFKTKGQ
jgi:hypothetical protein